MKLTQFLALAIATSAALVGCNSVEGKTVDPSFTEQSYKSSGFVVGAVVTSDGTFEEAAKVEPKSLSSKLAGKLKTSINAEREGVKVAMPSLLAEKLGEGKYNELLKNYRAMGEVDTGLLKSASPSLSGIKYAVFGYVESDSVKNNRSESEAENSTTKTVRMTSTRVLKTRFNVVDLHKLQTVWSGSISAEKSASNEYQKSGLALVELVKAVSKSEDNFQYPAPPPAAETIEIAFNRFADNLPED